MNVGWHSSISPRLLAPARERETFAGYRGAGGYADGIEGSALIEALERSGLRGRGGAAFPAAVKWRSVADRSGPCCVVANGEEGEPTSFKDRYLLRIRPHLVIDGLLRAARAVGAGRAVIYLSDATARRSVGAALTELRSSLPGLAEGVEVEVFAVPSAYVAGEETAAVRAINGGPAKPTAKPPRPFEEGVDGVPTLVQNVETLANAPFIARHGPEAFRAVGSGSSPGTVLLTASGACTSPGLYEVPLGIAISEAFGVAGGLRGPVRGFLMGGYFAGLLGPRGLELPLDYDVLREAGSGLGCAAITALGPEDCPVQVATDVMAYFAREQSNQCGPCTRGTAAMRDALLALTAGEADESDLANLSRWSATLAGRGACALLDGAAALAASLLREFPGEVRSHLESGCESCRSPLPGRDEQARPLTTTTT